MDPNKFVLLTTIILALNFQDASSTDTNLKTRTVFPSDFVKFVCKKTRTAEKSLSSSKEMCIWTFLTTQNETKTAIHNECIKRKENETVTKGIFDTFEGYVSVPEKVKAFGCADADGSVNFPEPISVQNVRLAKPFSSLESDVDVPTIILQRFSNDYAARLAAHDVTNQEVVVDGNEVERIKFLCIYNTNVMWTNITAPKQRVLGGLKERDKSWLSSKSNKKEKKWINYLNFLLDVEKDSTKPLRFPLDDMQVVYTLPLTIRNVTSATTRTYECRSLQNDTRSSVSILVENPRMIGPDEIAMIQQISEILESLAQGKGKGNEPWYTLASMLSIILVLFMYYCKQKLQQQNESNQSTSKPPEEVEIRTRLQVPSTSRNPSPLSDQDLNLDRPVVVTEQR